MSICSIFNAINYMLRTQYICHDCNTYNETFFLNSVHLFYSSSFEVLYEIHFLKMISKSNIRETKRFGVKMKHDPFCSWVVKFALILYVCKFFHGFLSIQIYRIYFYFRSESDLYFSNFNFTWALKPPRALKSFQ